MIKIFYRIIQKEKYYGKTNNTLGGIMPDQTLDEIRIVQEINKARNHEKKKREKEIEEEIKKENEDYLKEIQNKL